MIHDDSGFCSSFIEGVLETITDKRLDPFGDRDCIHDGLMLARRNLPPEDQLAPGCVGQVSHTNDDTLLDPFDDRNFVLAKRVHLFSGQRNAGRDDQLTGTRPIAGEENTLFRRLFQRRSARLCDDDPEPSARREIVAPKHVDAPGACSIAGERNTLIRRRSAHLCDDDPEPSAGRGIVAPKHGAPGPSEEGVVGPVLPVLLLLHVRCVGGAG